MIHCYASKVYFTGGPPHTLSLYLPVLSESSLCGLLFRCASLGQEKFFLPLLDIDLCSLSFPACSLVTILTELSRLPLTQLTDVDEETN